jgi:hypothetical protein
MYNPQNLKSARSKYRHTGNRHLNFQSGVARGACVRIKKKGMVSANMRTLKLRTTGLSFEIRSSGGEEKELAARKSLAELKIKYTKGRTAHWQKVKKYPAVFREKEDGEVCTTEGRTKDHASRMDWGGSDGADRLAQLLRRVQCLTLSV